MKRPKGILFDHDGVLVASEPLHFKAWQSLLAELGMSFPTERMKHMVGKTAPETIAYVLDQCRPGWTATQFDVHALALRKNDFYLEFARTELAPYPGVPEGLEWLRKQGIRAAVVSNAKRRELETALVTLGLAPFLDHIISRDDVAFHKPDPRPYLQGAAALGFSVADCIAVEDSPPGLQAALLAGVPAAAVMTNFSREALERPVAGRAELQPIWIGASMVEFFEWVHELQ